MDESTQKITNTDTNTKDHPEILTFSDVSKEIEDLTGIEGIDLFPGVRKWKAVKSAEKLAAAIPEDLRGLVVRKLIGSIFGRLLGRKR